MADVQAAGVAYVFVTYHIKKKILRITINTYINELHVKRRSRMVIKEKEHIDCYSTDEPNFDAQS